MTCRRTGDFIDLALTSGFIQQGQADLLKEELSMFPGGNVVSIMVRRGILTLDQAKELETPPEATPAELDEDDDMDYGPDHFPDFEIIPNQPAASRSVVVKPQPQIAPPAQFGAQTTSARVSASGVASAPQLFLEDLPIRSGSAPPAPQGEARRPPQAHSISSASNQIQPDPQMIRIFKLGRERQCSDLHITVNKPPYMRHEGKLVFLHEEPVTAQMAQRLIYSVLTNEQQAKMEQNRQVDFSFECAGAGRFRANVYRQRNGLEGAFRFIPDVVPTFTSLNLPGVLEKLTTYPQGLNLVTGPGGCGKTSTVAAMLEHINSQRHEHIITVEDPVEIVFQPKYCQITQREVGTHTDSFATALRTALRQDPDVVMIGELRDLETTSISITAAETGHLVFGTLHTSSAVRTVARILDVYPPAQRAQICMMVAESLRGILSQQLVPRKDGNGRACAMEILFATTGVTQMIKEGKTHQLVSQMQSGRKSGMLAMDDALMDLFQAGTITGNIAWSHAENKTLFDASREGA